MAEAVVDRLEVVEVDEQHRHGPVVALLSLQGMLHTVPEQGPVGQARDRIMEGLVGELLLDQLSLAHVSGVQHDAAHLGMQ